MQFPSITSVARRLIEIKPWIDDSQFHKDETPYLEVRLQVHESGDWDLHTSDPQYDTDHRGWWGGAVLERRSNCREVAREMIEEARDQCDLARHDA